MSELQGEKMKGFLSTFLAVAGLGLAGMMTYDWDAATGIWLMVMAGAIFARGS